MSTQDRKAKAQAAARTTGRGANVIVVAGIVIVLAMALVVGGVIWASRDDGASTTGTSQLPDGVTKGEPIEPFASAKPAEDAPEDAAEVPAATSLRIDLATGEITGTPAKATATGGETPRRGSVISSGGAAAPPRACARTRAALRC